MLGAEGVKGRAALAAHRPQELQLPHKPPHHEKKRSPLADDETKTCREFTLEGIGQTSSGYARIKDRKILVAAGADNDRRPPAFLNFSAGCYVA